MHKPERNKTMWIIRIRYLLVLCLPLVFMPVSGCIVRRGSDFGHWALAGERYKIMQVAAVPEANKLTGGENMLILPLIGDLPDKNRAELFLALNKEVQHYFPAHVIYVDDHGPLKDYVRKENLVPTGNIIDQNEALRLGRLLGVSHVLCTHISRFRPYQPQVLTVRMVVLDTSTDTKVTELNASFDAAEQDVVWALSEYLQGRRARKYDQQNLDIMLASPAEYGAFAMSRCAYVLSEVMWKTTRLKNEPDPADSKKEQ